MKKNLLVAALALAVSAVAGPRAAAEGGFKICFGVSCSKWNPCGGGGGACFPCVDPALFGLPGTGPAPGYGYAGYAGYAPYGYAPAPDAAPAAAPAQTSYYPQWGNPYGYQPVGYYAPFSGYYRSPSYWYGY